MSPEETEPDEVAENPAPPQKTRWGCIALIIIPTLLFCWGMLHDLNYENQPLEVHLHDIFKGSGFEIPNDVADLTGVKSIVDFQGDFSANVSFTVRPEQVDALLHLDPKFWKNPADFQPTTSEWSCAGQIIPQGTYAIQEMIAGEE
ncbi:MAG TPA: hypothetical protein VGE67_13590, partial [Haloferula sp.]